MLDNDRQHFLTISLDIYFSLFNFLSSRVLITCLFGFCYRWKCGNPAGAQFQAHRTLPVPLGGDIVDVHQPEIRGGQSRGGGEADGRW